MNAVLPLTDTKLIALPSGEVVALRPVVPTDELAEREFVARLSPAARHDRFHGAVNGLTDAMARYLTCVDQQRHVAVVLTVANSGTEQVIGDARYVVNEDGKTAEFAIVLADRWQGCGLAEGLVDALIASARRAGLRWLVADVLATNMRMLGFAQRLGFVCSARGAVDGVVRIERAVDIVRVKECIGAHFIRLLRRWIIPRQAMQPAQFLAPF